MVSIRSEHSDRFYELAEKHNISHRVADRIMDGSRRPMKSILTNKTYVTRPCYISKTLALIDAIHEFGAIITRDKLSVLK